MHVIQLIYHAIRLIMILMLAVVMFLLLGMFEYFRDDLNIALICSKYHPFTTILRQTLHEINITIKIHIHT